MNKELVCPFCQQELRSVIQQEGENTHTTWYCPKCGLEKYKWACGNKTLWQALIDTKELLDIESSEHEMCHTQMLTTTEKLERTRKALDKAKWWLHEIVESHRYTPISTAEMALKEITALEQKDK